MTARWWTVMWLVGCGPGDLEEGRSAGDCSDEADNDGDGLFDCDDDGCTGSPACDAEPPEDTSESDTGETGDTSPPTDNQDSRFSVNGYGQSGPWRGYLVTAVDGASAITPSCTEDGASPCFSTSGAKVCASGSVVISPDFSAFAQVLWNLNQAVAPPNQPGDWTVTGTGVQLEVLMNTSSPLRVFVQDGTGTVWCKELVSTESAVTVPWGELETECWAGGANQAALQPGTALQSVGLWVPSSDVAAREFDLCWIDATLVP